MPDPFPERWHRIDTLFAHALDLPPGERDGFLREACPDDEERAAVLRLLRASEEAAGFLAEGAADWAGPDLAEAFDEATMEAPECRRLGPWHLVREVGRGGMSVVWLAERADGAFEQEVAVKLLRPGWPAPNLARRLEAERRILAGLDHPHIARVLDGGVAPDGRPYLVMEYVEGEPLDAYAARKGLAVEARLRLFLQVCEAVAYAHRRLVVHRDLKPSNVLVAEGDRGRPHVKLLDFGIAKLVEGEEAGAAPLTRTGERWLTPEYAAPEQVRGEAVTTAVDVYALGVLLFELLTGRRPFRGAGSGRHALERAILEEEPPRPSAAAAEGKRLRGDLDAVVLKALRKEPEGRYVSADALADDLRRHLNGHPVAARRGSLAYRAGAFVRRYRAGLATAAGVVGLVAVLVGFYTARLATARDRAEGEAREASAAVEFLVELFDAGSPSEAQGDSVTVRGVLDRGAERVADELADQPLLQATMRQAIGRVYSELAAYGAADTLLTAALDARRRLLPPDHPDIAETLVHLAELRHRQARVSAADSLYRLALAIQERALPPEDPRRARTLTQLGVMARQQGRYADADAFYADALAIHRLQRDSVAMAETLYNLGILNLSRGQSEGDRRQLEDAERLLREAFAIERRLLGERHPEVNYTRANLGLVLFNLGRLEDAERLLREAVAIERDVSGPEHPRYARRLWQLSAVPLRRGDLGETEALMREGLAILRLDPENALRLLFHEYGLADVLRRQGRYAEAEALLRRGLAASRLPPEDYDVVRAHIHLGRVLVDDGRSAEAEPLLRQALARSSDSENRAVLRTELGRAVLSLGRPAEAEPLLRMAYDSLAVAPVETIREVREEFETARDALAALYRGQGRAAEAARLSMGDVP